MGQSQRKDKPRCSKKCGGIPSPVAVKRTDNYTYVRMQCGCGHVYVTTSSAAERHARAHGFNVKDITNKWETK